MKQLYETILRSTGTGRYKIGAYIKENGVPCTVIGEYNGYLYLVSDIVNFGTESDFVDIRGINEESEIYKKIYHTAALFEPVSNTKKEHDVSVFISKVDLENGVHIKVRNILKKYKDWEIPTANELRNLNLNVLLIPNVTGKLLSGLNSFWCYDKHLLSKTDGKISRYSLVLKNTANFQGNYVEFPLRLIKKIKL